MIFNAWRRRFGALVLAEAGVPEDAWTARPEFIRLLLTSPEAAQRWCGGDCGALALRALADAVARLAPVLGPDPAMWRWGQRHVARFEHPLLRFAPLLGPLTRLEAVTGGDDETVSRGGMREFGEHPFAHVHGSGLRLVADLAETEATLAIIATGQSGHPLSRHWGDLLLPWRDGGMLRLTREPARAAGRLILTP